MSDEKESALAGHEDERSTSSTKNTSNRRIIIFEIATLVVSLSGAVIGGIAQPYLTHRQSNEDQVREKRAEVYPAYLNAANDYFNATSTFFAELNRRAAEHGGHVGTISVKSRRVLSQFFNDRSNYQGEVNDLYVYGSDAAWSAHKKIAATLPPAIGSYDGGDIFPPDKTKFTRAFTAFQSVECHELPAIPRARC